MKPHGILGVVASCALGLHHLKGMTEIWKDIKGYESIYQVSDLGNVRSLDRTIINKRGFPMFFEGCIRKQRECNKGYLIVSFRRNRKIETFRIHRLEAIAFIPNPENKKCVNHKNGIKTDNRLCNLEWSTYSENNKHAYRTGLKTPTCLGKFGKDHLRSIPIVKLNNSFELIGEYEGLLDAERKTGISHKNIGSVCRGKRNKAGGFRWKYKTDYDGSK